MYYGGWACGLFRLIRRTVDRNYKYYADPQVNYRASTRWSCVCNQYESIPARLEGDDPPVP